MGHTIRLQPDGLAWESAPGQTLMESADAALVSLPSSCRNGTCRTCISHLLQGHAYALIEWPGLSAEEKAQGCILPCVYAAASDLVLQTGFPSAQAR